MKVYSVQILSQTSRERNLSLTVNRLIRFIHVYETDDTFVRNSMVLDSVANNQQIQLSSPSQSIS